MNDHDLPNQTRGAVIKLVNYAEARLELLQCEWAIERLRLAGLLTTMISMLFFSFLTIVLGVVLIIACYWDTPRRLIAVGITLAASCVCAIVSAVWHRARHREPSALFQRSVEECSRDRQAIDALR